VGEGADITGNTRIEMIAKHEEEEVKISSTAKAEIGAGLTGSVRATSGRSSSSIQTSYCWRLAAHERSYHRSGRRIESVSLCAAPERPLDLVECFLQTSVFKWVKDSLYRLVRQMGLETRPAMGRRHHQQRDVQRLPGLF
jgi:hypothetical protein